MLRLQLDLFVIIEEHCFFLPRNVRNWTPLDLAAAGGHEDIVQLLLDANVAADPLDLEKVTVHEY